MEFRNLKTFLRIADLLSFTEAATELGYSQSAVTMQIQQLEQELGVKLFDRIGKNIKLTDEGRSFAEHAADVMDAVQSAKDSVNKSDEIIGTLRIGMAESLLTNILPDVLTEFHKQCPKVETVIFTPLNLEMFSMLKANEIDIMYFVERLTYDSEWVKVFERAEKAYFVAPKKHPFADGRKVSLKQILKEPMILTEKGISYRHELEQLLAKGNYELQPSLEAGNTDLIIDMLLRGGGISFLPYYAVEKYIDNGKLAIINNDEIDINIWSQLAYHKKKWLTPQMQIFIDILKNRV